MKKALVVVCHGSKSKKSREEFKSLLAEIKEINQNRVKPEAGAEPAAVSEKKYSETAGAFLEFADPQLEKTVQNIYQRGIKEIDIFPLFIFSGYHLCQDLPQRLKKLEAELDALNYNILNHPAHYADFAEYIFAKALLGSTEA